MKKLSLKEVQNEELKIFKKVIDVLEKNCINYSLCGGTLLGAIRHKGFIPWDDDIDIFLTRPEYNRFIKAFLNDNEDSELELQSPEIGNSFQPFTKCVNKGIIIKDNSVCDQKERYLWIDIFPIDGLPNNKLLIKLKYRLISTIKKLLYVKEFKTDYSKGNFIKNVFRSIIRPVSFLFSNKTIIRIAKGNYKKAKYVGDLVWGYGPQEMMKKEMAEDLIEIEFEDMKVKVIKNYDEFLTKIYGDYMKLPPIEKRRTHNIEAWRKKN